MQTLIPQFPKSKGPAMNSRMQCQKIFIILVALFRHIFSVRIMSWKNNFKLQKSYLFQLKIICRENWTKVTWPYFHLLLERRKIVFHKLFWRNWGRFLQIMTESWLHYQCTCWNQCCKFLSIVFLKVKVLAKGI